MSAENFASKREMRIAYYIGCYRSFLNSTGGRFAKECDELLLIAISRRQMQTDIHGVVQDAADGGDVRINRSIKQKMSRISHAAIRLDMRPAMAKMIGTDTVADLGTRDAAMPERVA